MELQINDILLVEDYEAFKTVRGVDLQLNIFVDDHQIDQRLQQDN